MKYRRFKVLTSFVSALAILVCTCGCGGSDDNSNNSGIIGTVDIGDFNEIKPVEIPDPLPENALPNFVEYFMPEGVKTTIKVPGGDKLPAIGAEVKNGAPAISEFSDITYEDETLAITGDNLTGATLTVWAEGLLTDVTPLRTDNSKMQAVVPAGAGKSMMIIWPKNDKGIGAPVRVNAPKIMWTDKDKLFPERTDDLLRITGSGLYLEGKTPIVLAVHSDGTQELLEIKDANPYQIKASYPKALKAGGRCKIYVHNGTGGIYGWSDAQFYDVEKDTVVSENKLKTFKVEDYGAKADDDKSDDAAIAQALAAAETEGGGIIRFGKGEYNFLQTITVSGSYPKGLVLVGAGMGDFDKTHSLSASEYAKRGVIGTNTIIRFADPKEIPTMLLHIDTDHVTVRDMNINGADDGKTHKYNVMLHGNDITMQKVRFVKSDVRDFGTGAHLNVTANLEIDNGSKNISILDCDFRSKASAISIANIEGIWPWGYYDASCTVKNVTVKGCSFYGYTGPYTHPKGRKAGDHGEISLAITAINLDGGVFENNTIQGYDREHHKLLVRAFYMGLPTRHTYIANNTIKNVGNYPDSGYDNNTGEQILFHGQSRIGSIFEVKTTSKNIMTVSTEGIIKGENGKVILPCDTTTNAGSVVPDGFALGTAGTIFVTSGKGAGQIRTVTEYDIKENEITFTVSEPFAIEPDSTSIITLSAPFMNNIIYNNDIGNDKPTLSKYLKTGGVLMFLESCGTIIANNTIHNMAFGIALNSTFKMPTYWTTVRDNKITGITEIHKDAAQGGDTTLDAAFLCDTVRGNAGEHAGWDKYNVWYTLGNVFRNNDCSDGDVGGELVTNRWNLTNPGIDQYFGEDKGNAMSIFENNKFTNVAQGITVGNPAYWSLIRNNAFSFKNKAGYVAKEIHNYNPMTNFKLLHISQNKIISDANNTATK